jgi:tetratricopeptide (TPR) repeat protein
MKRLNRYSIFILLFAVLLSSCKTHRKASGSEESNEKVDSLSSALRDSVLREAKDFFEEENGGDESRRLLQEGLAKKNAGDLMGALELFDKAVQADTTNLDAYFERASANYALMKYVDAARDDDLLYSRSYPNPIVYARVAQRHSAAERWAAAVETYQKGISLSDTSLLLNLQLGNLYVHLSRYEEAVNTLERAMQLGAPGTAVFYSNLGYSYSRIGDHKKAVFYLSKAIEMNPTDRLIYAFRGLSLLNMRMFENAEADYKFYLEEQQMDVIALYNLGRTQWELKKFDEAIKTLEKAAQIQPGYMDTYYFLGLAYGGKNDYKTALKWLDKAVEQDPTKGVYYYNRGIAKGQISIKADFCSDFKKAYELGFEGAKVMIDQYCTK